MDDATLAPLVHFPVPCRCARFRCCGCGCGCGAPDTPLIDVCVAGTRLLSVILGTRIPSGSWDGGGVSTDLCLVGVGAEGGASLTGRRLSARDDPLVLLLSLLRRRSAAASRRLSASSSTSVEEFIKSSRDCATSLARCCDDLRLFSPPSAELAELASVFRVVLAVCFRCDCCCCCCWRCCRGCCCCCCCCCCVAEPSPCLVEELGLDDLDRPTSWDCDWGRDAGLVDAGRRECSSRRRPLASSLGVARFSRSVAGGSGLASCSVEHLATSSMISATSTDCVTDPRRTDAPAPSSSDGRGGGGGTC